MAKFRAMLVCVLILTGSSASAQPIFETEHDWCVQIGDGEYGIVQTVQIPGEFRSTNLHIGSRTYEMRFTVYQLVGLAALSLIVGVGVWMRSQRLGPSSPQ